MFKPGTQVGGCRIVRYLATGDVAEVYEVIDATGARRALKIFEREAPLDSAQQHRLALGGEATAMVEHINVVRFIDIGIHHGRVWILLDLVEGSDLRSDLRQLMVGAGGALPVDRAVSLLRQACDGLAAVHKQEIIHRDLKPENLLVTRDDIARVTGFGSARLPGWGMKTTTTQRTSSAYYMAPEYIKHGTVDTKMDVYAMGVILYEAISGKNPIMPGPATLANIIAAQLDVEPPPLGGVPGDLAHLLRWAMVKNPADRCSLRQFIDDLDRVLGRLRAQRRGAARSVPLPNREPGLALTEPAMPAWRSDETNATTPTAASIPAPVPGGTIRMSAAGGPMQGGPDWGAERSASDRLGRDQTRDAVLPPETLRAPPAVGCRPLLSGRGSAITSVQCPASTWHAAVLVTHGTK